MAFATLPEMSSTISLGQDQTSRSKVDVKVKLQDHVLHINHLDHVLQVRSPAYLCTCSFVVLITMKRRHHYVGFISNVLLTHPNKQMCTQFLSDTQEEMV